MSNGTAERRRRSGKTCCTFCGGSFTPLNTKPISCSAAARRPTPISVPTPKPGGREDADRRGMLAGRRRLEEAGNRWISSHPRTSGKARGYMSGKATGLTGEYLSEHHRGQRGVRPVVFRLSPSRQADEQNGIWPFSARSCRFTESTGTPVMAGVPGNRRCRGYHRFDEQNAFADCIRGTAGRGPARRDGVAPPARGYLLPSALRVGRLAQLPDELSVPPPLRCPQPDPGRDAA